MSLSVMMSLKAFAPTLATALGTTPAAVYERQRALIRTNLLPAPVGRGRGNGLPASAQTVAMILIAMLVTDNLSDTDERVQILADAEATGDRKRQLIKHHKARCLITGARNFKAALVAILRSEELASSVAVQVSRNALDATIYRVRGRPGQATRSEFAGSSWFEAAIKVEATLEMDALKTICLALQADKKGE
jgi:hypothetical protein